MHAICKTCFDKAGPLETLSIGVTGGAGTCMYCERRITDEENRKSYRLPGDTPLREVCRALGISTHRCSYFDFVERERDITEEFERELAKDPAAITQRALEWLGTQDEPRYARLARLIEVLAKR